jgi:dihydrofolate reductase
MSSVVEVRTISAGVRTGRESPHRGRTEVSQLLRVQCFNVSQDGFAAGEGQSLEHPFGHASPADLFAWAGATASWVNRTDPGGSRGLDDYFTRDMTRNIGAEIMGRNKFGPQRGPWADEEWKGWWDDDPPFHTPVFVLTHHPRPTLEMKGGTTFHFIDASPAEALKIAHEAADGLDVRIGGGPSTVRQFLAADLIDHLHVVMVPLLLGRGEQLWDGSEGLEQRFDIEAVSTSSGVTHLTFDRR